MRHYLINHLRSKVFELCFQSAFKTSEGVNLLFKFGPLRFDFCFQRGLLCVDQTRVFNFSFNQLDFHLLHLNLLFVVLHLLRRIADFRFDLVELRHHLLDLLGQTLTNANLSVVLVLLRLGLVQLRL